MRHAGIISRCAALRLRKRHCVVVKNQGFTRQMATVIFEMFLAKTVKFTSVCRVTAYVVHATSVCVIRADGGGSRSA